MINRARRSEGGVDIMPDSDAAATVAGLQISIGAVGIEPDERVVFASGLHSPIYCDNRLFLSHPAERRALIESWCDRIRAVAGTDWDGVAGVATSGIPFAAWVAMTFDRPMVYVRPDAKDHGRGRQVEGGLAEGKRVILVEDLVTTGGSALAAVAALRSSGLVCDRCFAIFDYGFSVAATHFEAEHVALSSLTNLDALLDVMRARNAASAEDVERVRRWRDRVNGEQQPAMA
jgi:orotate phosphoribosyltransferase